MKHTLVKTVASVMSLCMLASAMPFAYAAGAPVYPGDRNLIAATETFISHTGEECSVDCAKDNEGNTWLVDLNRKIKVSQTTNSQRRAKKPNSKEEAPAKWDLQAEVLMNAEAFYDYYCNVLGNTDFDILGNGDGTLYLVVMDGAISGTMAVMDGLYFDDASGASWRVPIAFFTTEPDGPFYNMGVDRGTVTHELMHLITGKKLGWVAGSDESMETRALQEAYSDIFGELSEENPDWLTSADAIKANSPDDKKRGLRNIADPANSVKPDGKITKFYTAYDVYKSNQEYLENCLAAKEQVDGEHAFYLISTIISHAAYEMYAAGIAKDELAKVWYASINYYTGNTKQATLLDCCDAVCAAAADYFYGKYNAGEANAKLRIVKKAFAEAHLMPYPAPSQAEAESTEYMAEFVEREQEKFPSGTYWNTGDPDTWSNEAVYGDHTSFLPMGPTVRPFFGLTGWQTEEEYFQCAGFAKKLQEDYFGRTVMVQDDDPNYVPQIGDHIRFDHYLRSTRTGEGHSVFVTAVDGDTITYADCNDDGYCTIKWNQTMKLTRNSEGKIYIEGAYGIHDEFAWVERPLKQGDVNADGKIDRYDCWQLRYLAEGKADDVQENEILRWNAANMNGDSKIDLADLDLLDVLTYSPSAKNKYGFVAY